MYQYQGYEIQISDSDVFVRSPSGEIVGDFETTQEAEIFVDTVIHEDNSDVPIQVDDKSYYVFRIHKQDVDNYSNYQYWTGRGFKYGTANILYMTKDHAENVLNKYAKQSWLYDYHVSKSHK